MPRRATCAGCWAAGPGRNSNSTRCARAARWPRPRSAPSSTSWSSGWSSTRTTCRCCARMPARVASLRRRPPRPRPRSTPSWPVPPGNATRKRSRATTRASSFPDRPTRASPSSETAEPAFPTAAEYASGRARHGALAVVDLQAEQSAVTADYDNRVLLDVDDHCMRLAVFEGEYRWHQHPDSDELFLVVGWDKVLVGKGGARHTLAPWQAAVLPAGTVHRTRAVGPTVTATFERQGARAVFVERPAAA